jgi:hypothetical protein
VLEVTHIKRTALALSIAKQVGCGFAEANFTPALKAQALGKAAPTFLVTHAGW